MTSEQFSLRPASGDDGGASLSGFELAARSVVQFGQALGTIVRQGMALEPCPDVLHRIELRSVRGQAFDHDLAARGIDIVAHHAAAVSLGAVPQDEQRSSKVTLQCVKEFHDALLVDRAVVEAKAESRAMQPGNRGNMIPVEAELHDGAVPFGCPGANPRGTLRESCLVDEDDQPSLLAGFFLSPGQVRFFQCSIATSSRSSARRSGRWLEKPNCPNNRQT